MASTSILLSESERTVGNSVRPPVMAPNQLLRRVWGAATSLTVEREFITLGGG